MSLLPFSERIYCIEQYLLIITSSCDSIFIVVLLSLVDQGAVFVGLCIVGFVGQALCIVGLFLHLRIILTNGLFLFLELSS